MQLWCVKSTCDRLPEDAQLSIEYLLSDEAMPEEKGVLQRATEDGHQSEQRSMTQSWDPAGWTLTLKQATQAPTLFCRYGVVSLT